MVCSKNLDPMAGTHPARVRLFRFGPFELDVRAGELRKHGIRIKLREQPVQILLMLLEHPGDVVLREEIRLRLWPNNTVVEFDHGINAAVQKLRDALGESADSPRNVETVARRGYRFLGEVEGVGEPQPDPIPMAAPAAAPMDVHDLTGKTLSHYRILGKLGEGGMGVVYRAEDLKLGRHVALKFLPREDGELPQSMFRRFEREARVASALNHPHICTIYGLEDLDGRPAIVMELVEGETLVKRLANGPLPPEQSVTLAAQIAGALAEAHRRGVVHRDLKPANIMLAKSGVKVLDFGLARMERTAFSAGMETLTQDGAIAGTLYYMSPEQLQGKEVDARSDIFSFGLVLYEMLTGRRAFDGDSAASVMAGIMERDAPPLEPFGLNRVVQACLAKDPDDRFQSVRDVKRAIEWSNYGGGAAALVPNISKKWIPWVAAAVFAALALLAWLHMGPATSAPQRPWADRTQVGNWTLSLGAVGDAVVSPDGSAVTYRTPLGLFLRRMNSMEETPVYALDRLVDAPSWSPDGSQLLFRTLSGLIRLPLPDGPPSIIWPKMGITRGSAWAPDGTILSATVTEKSNGGKLYLVTAKGGEPTPLEIPGFTYGWFFYIRSSCRTVRTSSLAGPLTGTQKWACIWRPWRRESSQEGRCACART